MGKAPAYQWYTGDWRKDTQVQMCCMATRGTWREMLDCMWDAPVRGELIGTASQIQKLLGCTENEWKIFLHEFSTLNVGELTVGNDGVLTFRNRRMFREEQDRISHKIRQHKYLDKKKTGNSDEPNDANMTPIIDGTCDADLTLPSSSSSSSSSSKNKRLLSDEDFLKSLKEKFHWVNFDQEMTKIDAWFMVHTDRKKTRRFIVKWISKIEKPMEIKDGKSW